MMRKLLGLLTLGLVFTTQGQTTFADIKSVLINNCASCHRDGGGAPFDILDYTTAYNYRYSILHEVNEGYMPPWQADTSYMRFVGEREISEADKNAIIAWVEDGGLRGDSTVEVKTPDYPESLLNGEADLVITMPVFASNADFYDAYNTVVIPTGLTESRIVRAVEVVPDNPEFTHHVIVNADEGGAIESDMSGTAYDLKGDIAIGTYAPGTNPIIYPNSDEIKLGVELPAGADIVLQVHTPNYYSGGTTLGEEVGLKVKLFFYDESVESEVRQVYNSVPLQYWEDDFYIPAGEVKTIETEVELSDLTNKDLSVYSAFPHSHQICTEILNYAYNGTDTIPLIYIDGWDFEHQENYFYRNMIKLPKSYTLKAEHVFDNRASNHHNPFSPPQMISAGFNSNDEMLFDGFQFLIYQEGDELINIDSIITNEPLMQIPTVSGIGETVTLRKSYAYPNPMVDQSYIYFNHPHQNWSDYKLEVRDIHGKKIEMTYQIEYGRIRLNKGSVTAGTYLYQVVDSQGVVSVGKLVVN